MKTFDLLKISFDNLRRTKLRVLLTTSGVIVGIGALVSMVSFGAGMQKNISDTFAKFEVLTSIRVLPKKVGIDEMMSGITPAGEGKVLDDSVLAEIRQLPGVQLAYPEIIFPAKITLGMERVATTVRAIPGELRDYEPFKSLTHGRFFSSDTSAEILLSEYLAQRMGFDTPDAAIGAECTLLTAKLDGAQLGRLMSSFNLNALQNPFAEESTRVKVVGIWPHEEFTPQQMADAAVPLVFSSGVERLKFGNVFDILNSFSFNSDGYSALYVRATDMYNVEVLVELIESMGYGTFTLIDQLAELQKGFLLFDAALGAVGTIALFVAALGIINTMVMSVLERYKEIGIMKAIGATDGEVKMLFFFETCVIGAIGGVVGNILGWLVTRLANVVANYFFTQQEGITFTLDWFHFPWWLILGGFVFAVVVSLLAGLYPASRASKVDPVRALRYE